MRVKLDEPEFHSTLQYKSRLLMIDNGGKVKEMEIT